VRKAFLVTAFCGLAKTRAHTYNNATEFILRPSGSRKGGSDDPKRRLSPGIQEMVSLEEKVSRAAALQMRISEPDMRM